MVACGDFDGRQRAIALCLGRRKQRVVTKKIEAYMERRLDGQRVDKLTAILSFMNSEDHSHKMPSLVEYTKMLDITRGTNFFDTFPELAQYWIGGGSNKTGSLLSTGLRSP